MLRKNNRTEGLLMNRNACFVAIFIMLFSATVAAISCAQSPQSDEIFKKDLGSCVLDGNIRHCTFTIESEICNATAVKPCQVDYGSSYAYNDKNMVYNESLVSCYVIHDGTKLACGEPFVTGEEDYPWGTARGMAVMLPSCENGDVYQVITSSNFSNLRNDVVEDSWYFTMTGMNGTPAYSEWSRLEISVPKGMPMYYYFHSKAATATNTTVNGVTKYVFEQKGMPPLKEEEKMPAAKEVEDWMEYASSDDFGAVSSWLQSGYEDAVKPDESVIAKASEIVGNSQGGEAIGKLYDWTRKNIGYKSGTSMGFRPNNASYVLKTGYANSQDVGALLTALLKSRGFDAEPAIVASNRATRMGTLDQLNYIITVAHYQGKDIWMDATCATCPYGTVPWDKRDVPVLRFMTQDATETIPAAGGETNTSIRIGIKVLPNGTTHITQANILMDKLRAEEYRQYYGTSSKEQRNGWLQGAAGDFCSNFSNLEYSGQDLDNGKFEIKISLDCNGLAVVDGKKITLPTYEGNNIGMPHYLTATERVNDFDLGPTVYYEVAINFEFPEGYEVTTDIAPVSGGYENYTKTLGYAKQGNTAKLVFNAYSGPFVSKEGFASMKAVSTAVFNALTPIEAVSADDAIATPNGQTDNPTATPTAGGKLDNTAIAGILALVAIVAVGGYYLLKAKPKTKGGKKIKSRKGKKK